MTCTFFGHRDAPESIQPKLRETVTQLIEQCHVDCFYVGSEGSFDRMARRVLCELTAAYPHICYAVVLAYLPPAQNPAVSYPTVFPEGLESVPRRFSISHRNRWMLDRADYVVTYVTHPTGGAAQFAALAQRRHKHCINLAANQKTEG